MSISNFFKPKWQHTDIEVRKKYLQGSTNQNVLLKSSIWEENSEIVQIVINKISDDEALYKIVLKTEHINNKAIAVAKIMSIALLEKLYELVDDINTKSFIVQRIESLKDLINNNNTTVRFTSARSSVGGSYIVAGIDGNKFDTDKKQDGKKYEIWQGINKKAALNFLRKIPVDDIPPLFYVIVETPEGNFGKDLNGMFIEETGEDIF